MARTTINISFYNGDNLSLFMVRSGLSGYAAHHIDPSLTFATEGENNMRTSELTGHALNWAVAKLEGITDWDSVDLVFRDDEFCWYEPSSNWAQGGPIIEREHIGLWSEGYDWEAKIQTGAGEWLVEWDEESPLVAAMRCYVASKLGEEVEIPTELTQGEDK
jgi:hypothetical protein